MNFVKHEKEIIVQYSSHDDLRRSVYWIHRLQTWACTLPILDIEISKYRVTLHIPDSFPPSNAASYMMSKYNIFERLFNMGILVHPSRVPLSEQCFWCPKMAPSHIYMIDFSGFVSCEKNVVSFAQAPQSLSYSRYPYLKPFSGEELHIGIFIQIGSLSCDEIFMYVQNIVQIRNNRITIICSILDNFSKAEQTSIYDKLRRICIRYYRIDIIIHMISVTNTGMDIGSFLRAIQFCIRNEIICDILCKIHTKSDPVWRTALCDPILGNSDTIQNIVRLFTEIPDVGCCAANRWTLSVSDDVHNHDIVSEYCCQLNFNNPYTSQRKVFFVGGTIFWLRWSIIQHLFQNHTPVIENAIKKFQKGYITNTKSTHTHAWERLLGVLVSENDQQFLTFN